MMRITVDGEPIDDPGRSSEDIQRCTDVALQQANIQFGFDDLEADRRLAVAARPARVSLHASEDGLIADPVHFTMYANYSHFIDRAEVRIFDAADRAKARRSPSCALGGGGSAEWQASVGSFAATDARAQVRAARVRQGRRSTKRFPAAVARVRGRCRRAMRRRPPRAEDPGERDGAARARGDAEAPFDLLLRRSDPGRLRRWRVRDRRGRRRSSPRRPSARSLDAPAGSAVRARRSRASTRRSGSRTERTGSALQNIPLASGSVTIRGSAIPEGHSVWVAGHPVPVDASGNFVAQEILPGGHSHGRSRSARRDGNGKLYLRDIELKHNDWFFVGMADVTLSHNDTNGPIELLQGENSTYEHHSSRRRAARVLRERQVRRRLAAHSERRHARRAC